jgi:hypothetical protein
MNRFTAALTKTLVTASSLFQAAAIAPRPAKILMVGISLGALLTISNFVQPAKAQRLDGAREQALRACNIMEGRDPHDTYEGKKTGNRMFNYKACMAERGQIE